MGALSPFMKRWERQRLDLLTALGRKLERRGFPSWVSQAYGTSLLRCVKPHPHRNHRTVLVACIRNPGKGWLFVWPGGHAPADDLARAASHVAGYLAN